MTDLVSSDKARPELERAVSNPDTAVSEADKLVHSDPDQGPGWYLVAIPSSSPSLLTYEVPDQPQGHGETLRSGQILCVDVRGRPKVGILWKACEKPDFNCKALGAPLYGNPCLPEPLLRLLEWTSLYYLCPLPRLIHLCAPGAIWKAPSNETRERRFLRAAAALRKEDKKGKPGKTDDREDVETSIQGVKEADAGIADRDTDAPSKQSDVVPESLSHDDTFPRLGYRLRGEKVWPNPPALALSDEQEHALETLRLARQNPESPRCFLLEGITGSGKTEIYLAAAREVLESGSSVLVLVPEIALTPQMTMRFRAWFGDKLAVVHSGLTQAEMEREWFRIALGQAQIVLGVRRGVFTPLADVGLIIVDEEHDSSYKADDYPCIHARDVAVKRAHLEGAQCLLGSASPSFETAFNVKEGRYGHLRLSRRQKGASPQIEVFDSRPFYKSLGHGSHGGQPGGARASKTPERSSELRFNQSVILPPIIRELENCRAQGQQSMIIVNRRGYAHYAICGDCGKAQSCPHCAVTTTLHKGGRLEVCHHCGFQTPHRSNCASCGSTRLEERGFGTQMVEADVANQLPHLKTERLDRDVLTSPTRLAELLDRFRSGESDTLIGTQILAKGHDFPRVSLVAILHLEDALFLPDFRSAERTYQLLLQSAGRAGRGDVPGRVIVQSLIPEHPVLAAVIQNKGETFYRDELATRRLAGLPPYSRQIVLTLEHADEDTLSSDAFGAKRAIDEMIRATGRAEGLRLIGPHPAPIERLDGRYRATLSLSMPKSMLPRYVIPGVLQSDHFGSSRLRLDVDPFSFF